MFGHKKIFIQQKDFLKLEKKKYQNLTNAVINVKIILKLSTVGSRLKSYALIYFLKKNKREDI